MKSKVIGSALSHIRRSTHTTIRKYDVNATLLSYLGDEHQKDPLVCDNEFAKELIKQAVHQYPKIYLEEHPIYYAIVAIEEDIYIIGPVNIDYRTKEIRGKTISEYIASKHDINGKTHKIPFCDYEHFCEEVLLLFNVIKGTNMKTSELNDKNFGHYYYHEIRRELGEIYFRYQENEKLHNPYAREVREMNSIREGNVSNLIKSIDEEFEGEYAVLSKDTIRAKINLAIVGLAISARAAIEGGLSPEEAFSINDSYIVKVDSLVHIGQIDALVRQAKVHYAELVAQINKRKKTNALIEQCKDLIYKKMHCKIFVAQLAEKLHVSPEYLSTLFHKEECVTIIQYIMQKKIILCKNLLIYSEYTNEEIAYYFGFCSQSHFGKVFKKYTGYTPRYFRVKYGLKEFH